MDRLSKSKDINGKGKLQDKNQTKGENQGNSWLLRAAKGLGVAYLTIIGGSQGAEGRLLRSEASGLVPQGGDSRLPIMEGYALQSLQGLRAQKTDHFVASKPEALSHLDDPTFHQDLREIWPRFSQAVDEHFRGIEEASKKLHQEVSRETPSGETPSALMDRVPPPLSSEHFRSVPARDFESILQAAIRSRLGGTPSEEISRLAADTPSHPQEQGKNKEGVSLKLSKEEINSLKFFLDSLKKNPKALQCFQEVLKDNKNMEGIKILMEDKEFRKCALSELKDPAIVEHAILSLENPKNLQDLKKMLNNKEYREGIKNVMKDKEFKTRVLLEIKNKESGKQATSLLENEQSHISPAAAPNSLDTSAAAPNSFVIHDTSEPGNSLESNGDSSNYYNSLEHQKTINGPKIIEITTGVIGGIAALAGTVMCIVTMGKACGDQD